jgi:hypothetical protein
MKQLAWQEERVGPAGPEHDPLERPRLRLPPALLRPIPAASTAGSSLTVSVATSVDCPFRRLR